jgi:hypothetical protein
MAWLVKVDKNGTKYFADDKCRKCGGKGFIYGYEHIDGARCWECSATGRVAKAYTWKEYTPEYAVKLEERRKAKAIKEAPEANRKFFEKAGFNADGKTYIVLGNTYAIKDELKAAGAKWSDNIGWHFAEQNSNYESFELDISDIAEKSNIGVWQMLPFADVYAIVKDMKDAHAPKTASEYVGNIGDKIAATVTFMGVHTYTTHFTYYGETNYIYTFADENGNTLVWKTSKFQELNDGEKYTVKGTIKEHNEYKGDKQTALTRCKISKAA